MTTMQKHIFAMRIAVRDAHDDADHATHLEAIKLARTMIPKVTP